MCDLLDGTSGRQRQRPDQAIELLQLSDLAQDPRLSQVQPKLNRMPKGPKVPFDSSAFMKEARASYFSIVKIARGP